MGKRKDFSNADEKLLRSLTFEECKKHSLDTLDGCSLGRILYILKKCKSVDVNANKKTILEALNNGIKKGSFLMVNGRFKLPNHEVLYAQRRQGIEAARKIRKDAKAARKAAQSTLANVNNEVLYTGESTNVMPVPVVSTNGLNPNPANRKKKNNAQAAQSTLANVNNEVLYTGESTNVMPVPVVSTNGLNPNPANRKKKNNAQGGRRKKMKFSAPKEGTDEN